MPRNSPRTDASVYLGVDPGADGGMVALAAWGSVASAPLKTLTDRQVWEWLYRLRGGFAEVAPVVAMIEQVGGFVGADRGTAGMGPSMFAFGRSVGFLHGCLTASGIPYERVTPQKWQKAVGAPSRPKGLGKSQWKGLLLEHARLLYPHETPTRSTADALLLAHYCRLTHQERTHAETTRDIMAATR